MSGNEPVPIDVRQGGDNDISLDKTDGVAVATFNRPAVLNAFRAETKANLLAVFEEVEADDRVRVLVLTGAGRAFSSGQDLVELREMMADPDYLISGAARQLDELQELTRVLLRLRKPVVAAVNGVAVGLGAELALACDIRIASTDASIGFVESQRGLFETNAVMYLLPRMIGYGRAMELLLTGELVKAKDAERMGLVSLVVDPAELLPRAISVAQRIADNAPISVRLIKDVLSRTYDLDIEQMMQLEVEGMLTCLRSEDLQRGVDAFLNKRRPSYRGT